MTKSEPSFIIHGNDPDCRPVCKRISSLYLWAVAAVYDEVKISLSHKIHATARLCANSCKSLEYTLGSIITERRRSSRRKGYVYLITPQILSRLNRKYNATTATIFILYICGMDCKCSTSLMKMFCSIGDLSLIDGNTT